MAAGTAFNVGEGAGVRLTFLVSGYKRIFRSPNQSNYFASSVLFGRARLVIFKLTDWFNGNHSTFNNFNLELKSIEQTHSD
jgi:hypothetical protein